MPPEDSGDGFADDAVRVYYDTIAEREWERLDRADDGAIEASLHERALRTFLPKAPARVLDLGGGPGRWTLWLASQGHSPTLVELSPLLVDLARRRMGSAPFLIQNRVESTMVGDARDLSRFADGSFDAALALGPFYHLPEPGDRERALSELARVVRPDGVVFAAFMPPYLRLLAAAFDPDTPTPFAECARRILDRCRYDDSRAGRFTGASLTPPDEIAPLFARHGFSPLRIMASQGFLALVQTQAAALKERAPQNYQALLEIAWKTADDPSILGLAAHILYIGRKG